jgi:peptidyl-prolyl cis-trans isomerase B (cyclophilin B)
MSTLTVQLENGGSFTIDCADTDAPNTVKNFVDKAKRGEFNGLTFHRVENWVVQGGDPTGTGRGGGKMATELNTRPFREGAVGVARGGDIKYSNDMQFFVVTKDANWLDGQYANFGQVTKGMDVVKRIKPGDKMKAVTAS